VYVEEPFTSLLNTTGASKVWHSERFLSTHKARINLLLLLQSHLVKKKVEYNGYWKLICQQSNNIMTTLVLASTSPYRKTLLERLHLPFVTAAPDIDETAHSNEPAEALVTRLAESKARAIADQYPDALIIGSDQVAVIDGSILGKPGNHETAAQQLRNASGRQVTFLTGLCLFNTQTQQAHISLVPFIVEFRELQEAQIQFYLTQEKPYDCAGSFKSEGFGISLCKSMKGDDPNSLIGLPLIELIRLLTNEGVDVLSSKD